MAKKYISSKLHWIPALTNGSAHCPQSDYKWQKPVKNIS